MASSILNQKIDDLCNWEFIDQSDVVDDDADLVIYAEVQSLDSVSVFSSDDDESEDVQSLDLTSDARDFLHYADVHMAGSSPDADIKKFMTPPPPATDVDEDDDREDEEEDRQDTDEEIVLGKLDLNVQEVYHARDVHDGLAPHDNHRNDAAVSFPCSFDVMKNQIHRDVDHVRLSNGYHHRHLDSVMDDLNGEADHHPVYHHLLVQETYRFDPNLVSRSLSNDYDDVWGMYAGQLDESDGDGEYDLDDELVPWGVADKFERQRMRKLGKRASSKMSKSKRLFLQYSKPGCVRGKHGLGLKAYC